MSEHRHQTPLRGTKVVPRPAPGEPRLFGRELPLRRARRVISMRSFRSAVGRSPRSGSTIAKSSISSSKTSNATTLAEKRTFHDLGVVAAERKVSITVPEHQLAQDACVSGANPHGTAAKPRGAAPDDEKTFARQLDGIRFLPSLCGIRRGASRGCGSVDELCAAAHARSSARCGPDSINGEISSQIFATLFVYVRGLATRDGTCGERSAF